MDLLPVVQSFFFPNLVRSSEHTNLVQIPKISPHSILTLWTNASEILQQSLQEVSMGMDLGCELTWHKGEVGHASRHLMWDDGAASSMRLVVLAVLWSIVLNA